MMQARWAPPPSAHSLAALASHRRVYVDGVPRPEMRQSANPYVGGPYVGALPLYPPNFFPVVPSQSTPINNPAPGPSLPPAISQKQVEDAAVQAALAFELQAMKATIGGEPLFGQASEAWKDASIAAAKISIAATSANQAITAQNAKFRAQAYDQRRITDMHVASGQAQHPVITGQVTNPDYGWGWPEIYQQPDPAVPVYPGPLNPAPQPNPAGETDLPPAPEPGAQISTPLFLALLGAVGYVGYLLIKAAAK